ncbi:CCHC-type domain-containing protein [Heracleum sosnowskyi]|uniref:CCHC-type domain-containing protein n=1 Tax=Heracleum sosnowskyi TaxID=360622 RepID=A0AAD8NBU7_9APIA|nr:CCHC-type domain-containing protein [Heracleum sosnowskyi]
MVNARFTYQDMVNPLFLHPSDNSNSIQVDKLEGSSDYRAWQRAMEINLTSKRKLGFVKGTVVCPTDDPMQAEMWETSDNMVISWLTSNLSSTIIKYVIYMSSSRDIWANLEQRFSLTNGSRKYKLSKDLYDIKQGNLTVNDYYIAMRTIWEELDSMNGLLAVSNPNEEVTKLLAEIDLQREESKLFQFLNGLNEIYSPQRSQMLLLNPLPSVKNASSVMQQEAQRELIHGSKTSNSEFLAMFSKGTTNPRVFNCNAYGGKGHTQDKCWSVVGYPKWHNNYKGNAGPSQAKTYSTKPRWTPNPRQQNLRSANSAQTTETHSENTLFTPEQSAQLAQFM